MKNQNHIEDMLKITFISPNDLKPTEKFNQERVDELVEKIMEGNKWTMPLIVEKNNLVIMDGHHRHQAAKILRINKIPCILLTYDNPLLQLSSRIDNITIDGEKIIEAGLSGVPLEYKATKHDLKIEQNAINLPLDYIINA